ncbi:hypothetical protein GALMADRAFT_247265 [Galerina marginata CBS 339.88]|uniref:Ribonuclease H1 N-terminal domain-containing protein n=1 Tax=Galerina marginata (strain CBS 339.88) TaxID=685588 RepID=A0A067SYY0_GALM3|nr:hypothetical protein GALMADRAFT_247265 [Galerina marginata CBS 339.88]
MDSCSCTPTLISTGDSTRFLFECLNAGCTCACGHLPPEKFRWYSVVVGRTPGVHQGYDEQKLNTNGISGGISRYFELEEDAQTHFISALKEGIVTRVQKSTTTTVLSVLDLPTIRGFRAGDPETPDRGSWRLVIVGREPGVFLAGGTDELTLNLQGVNGASCKRYKYRSDAVVKFQQMLGIGEIKAVNTLPDIREVLSTDDFPQYL